MQEIEVSRLESAAREPGFDPAATQSLIAGLDLTPTNHRIAETWLSLWHGNELPDRRRLNPADLKQNLSHLALFDVVPGVSVTVRLAGTRFGAILGMELTGQDWIALAPESHRASRLGLFTNIAAGAFCIATRYIDTGELELALSEEILLPLAADPVDGIYPVLCHVDWKANHPREKIISRAEVTGAPISFEVIALPCLVRS